MRVFEKAVLMGLALLLAAKCPAQDITVSKPGADRFAIDLSGFRVGAGDETASLFLKTLESNLLRSGWFAVVGASQADFRITGDAGMSGAELRVKCEARRAGSGERLLGKSHKATAGEVRALAHKVSDELVLALTGRPGMASSRIAMVGTLTGSKELYLCDADGGGLVQITNDKTVSVSPKWGPDGTSLVYTSFRSRFPDVYLVNIVTGERECIARYPGLNACASISPDGRRVALTLSKDGNPDLFIKELSGGRLTRLTTMKHSAQASPSWSPDGRRIVFVSDVAGSPQLYLMSSGGGSPRRITSRGSENVDPDWGVNGLIAYSSRVDGRYVICVINPDTMEFRQISRANADYDSPSWAPDGRHIVCERRLGYRSGVFIIDTMSDSCISVLLETISGEWHSPSWSKK